MQGRTGKEDILGFSFNLCVLPAGLRLHPLRRGAGCCGERDDEASAAARSVHPHGIGARGPWARSPEAEVTGGRGGGPTEGAAEAAGR